MMTMVADDGRHAGGRRERKLRPRCPRRVRPPVTRCVRVAAALTATCALGAGVLLGGCGQAPARASSRSPSPRPSPRSPTIVATAFGVKGDSHTDDTKALETALKAAAKRRAVLLLGPGVFTCASSLKIPAGVSVRGAGPSTWIKTALSMRSGATFTRLRLGRNGAPSFLAAAGAHDLRFDHCTFVGGRPSEGGVVYLSQPCHDLTFLGCTIAGGPMDGVTIVDKDGSIHDVRFQGCTFRASRRMGFECISRGNGNGVYQRISLIGCTFAPQGSEAISFDGPALPAACLIDDVLVEGAGTNQAYPWGQGLEINGPTGFAVRRLTILRTRDAMLNLNCRAARCDWTFSDCVFDYTRRAQSTATADAARTINAGGMRSAVFTRCTFNAGHVAVDNGWLSDCSDNDFRTSTFLGSGKRAALTFVGASSGNLLP